VDDDDHVRQIQGHDLQLDPAVVEAEPVQLGVSFLPPAEPVSVPSS